MAKDADLREVHPYYEMEVPEKTRWDTIINFTCKVCGVSNSAKFYDLSEGTRPCKCSGKYRWSKEERIEQIEGICKDKGYTFNGFISKEHTIKHGRLSLTCNKHNHTWDVNLSKFVNSNKGCPICGGSKPTSVKEFLNKSKEAHGDKYSYDFVVGFKNTKDKVLIKCKKHNFIFEQTVYDHSSGKGCQKCASEDRWSKREDKVTQEEYIKRVKKVHGNKYDLSRLVFTKMSEKVIIGCEHGWKKIKAKNFTMGRGCSKCSEQSSGGYTYRYVETNKQHCDASPCSLYFIKLSNGMYKIGISKNPSDRLTRIKRHSGMEILGKKVKDGNLTNCFYLEQAILNQYRNRRAKLKELNKHFDGWTEVLKLNTKEVKEILNAINYMNLGGFSE